MQTELLRSARESMQQGSRSFAWASVFLPSASRERAYLLYQWCRRCDDQIDEAQDQLSARKAIEMLEREPCSPHWLSPLHQADFFAGLRMDVEHRRPESIHDLELYCFRVAGVVGLMMCPLLGATTDRAFAHASALGKAMQLTNIARDVQTDALMGRVYIPSELAPHLDSKLLSEEPEQALPAVKRLLRQADHWYREGFLGLAWLPWRTAFAIALAGLVYQRIGHQLLESARVNPAMAFRSRTVVPFYRKLWSILPAIGCVVASKLSARLGPSSTETSS